MSEENRDWEAEAREQGWKPLSEFKGPDDKWTDPRTFVEKGEKISGILKSRLDRQEQQIAELRKANKEYGDYQRSLRDKDRAAAERRIAELEAQRAEAITNGDGTQFTMLDREITQVRADIDSAPPVQNGYGPDVETQWVQENPWYGQDQALTAFADGVTGMVEAEGYQGKARLDEIARRTRETFPDRFENPNRKGNNAVDSGGELETEDRKAHTFENLPDDAKAACKRFVSAGVTTKEEYVKNFEWDE